MAEYLPVPATEYNIIWLDISIVIFNMILMWPIYMDGKT
jgi:hypothetical protein